MNRFISDYEQNHNGNIPTDEEIATSLGITKDEIDKCRRYQEEPVSLDVPVGEEEDSHLEDFIPSNSMATDIAGEQELMKIEIDKMLQSLTPKERRIIVMRFGLDGEEIKTLEEVGREFNVTRERIRQIEAKTLRKLRRTKFKSLREFLH